MSSTIQYNKANRRIWCYIKPPEFPLEPQGRAILDLVQQNKEISRFEILKQAPAVLTTKSTVSRIVSYYQRRLVELGCIRVMELEDYKKELELRKDKEMNGEIRENKRGGWEVKIGEDPWMGNYDSEDVARAVLRRNGLEAKEITKIDPEALIS